MQIIETDVLIVGGGSAGLTAAVYAAHTGAEVTVIDKAIVGKSGSSVSALQISGAGKWSRDEDSLQAFFEDIMESGRGLSESEHSRILVEEIESVIDDLYEWGLKVDLDENGDVLFTTTSGHRYSRSISAKKGNTGSAILQTLMRRASQLKSIQRVEHHVCIRLHSILGMISGALTYNLVTNEFVFFKCKSLILSTGGLG
jgi:succinate dehydrogenase/fumarate reductase flavoprotein subunit